MTKQMTKKEARRYRRYQLKEKVRDLILKPLSQAELGGGTSKLRRYLNTQPTLSDLERDHADSYENLD